MTAPQVDETPIDIPGVTDMALATPAGPADVRPVEIEELPTCNDQSENECKGKKHTEACVKNGVTGTCDAVYPTSECICRTFWAVIGAVRGGFNRIPELSRAAGMVERLQEFEGLQETLPGVHFGDRVQLQQVSFAFGGNPVFTNLNLEPALGERILVLGANGTGKSTLAHLLCGLLQPGSGSAATLPLERISAIIQPYDFIPGTVRDNVEHATAVSSPPQRILELAQCLGIVDSLDKNPSELSAGQRKRLEILMVLLKPADLYVLDEPLAGIDVESKNEIMQAVFETTHSKTLLVILHGDEQFHSRFDRVLDLTELSTSFYNEPK